MADASITISNDVRVFGGGPSSLWNAYDWGDFLWGEGTADILTDVNKLISADIPVASSVPSKIVYHLISETITVVGDMLSERKLDGAGYAYLYPDRTAEGESRTFTSWSSAASQTSGWSSATVSATTWS